MPHRCASKCASRFVRRRREVALIPTARHASRRPDSSSVLRVDFLGVLFIVWGVLTILIGAVDAGAGRRCRRAARIGLLASGPPVRRQLHGRRVHDAGHHRARLGRGARRGGHPAAAPPALVAARALSLGSVDLLLLPYGTALAAYAFWVLLREDARSLFDA